MMIPRELALITVLSLLVTHTTTMASPHIIDLALQRIRAGSVTEMKNRLLGLPFRICDPENYRRVIESLPSSIRDNRVSEGKLCRRVESVMRPVLELLGRGDKIKLFIYENYFLRAMVWQGYVLTISDSLADELHDDELVGTLVRAAEEHRA